MITADVSGIKEYRCTMPLGAEDRRLVPGSFSASSYYTGSLAPWYARLNQVYSWCTRYNRAGQWLQVSLGGSSTIKGVATQGRSNANQWVKSYTLSYSVDGYRFVPYREGSTTRLFQGNVNRFGIVFHRISKPFVASHVRFYPRSWYGWMSMRVELYGCPTGSVDFGRAALIVRITTQGRQDARQWVRTYYLRPSLDGIHFVDYKEKFTRKYFPGNSDQNTEVSHSLSPHIRARFIRVVPWTWYSVIAMRVEFYGCITDKCKMPLGLEDFRLDSGALTASSYVNYNHGPERARLNWPSGHSRAGGWVAKVRNSNQWLQVELDRPAKITGVATQGRYDAYQWVTTYTVSYSMDGKTFKLYLEYGRNKLFSGNYNRYTIVKHELTPPIRAKFIRFNPKGYRSYVAMRIELYGCYYGGERFCNNPVGLQHNRLKNPAITASSYLTNTYAPRFARLHGVRSWISKHNNHNQWLQVDLGRAMKITGIATQGRQDAAQWTTAYYVKFSMDGIYFAIVRHWWNAVKIHLEVANRIMQSYRKVLFSSFHWSEFETLVIDSKVAIILKSISH
ncbi:PREDICTED: EGF-like repeat and discoidin I-like domain-containing protein 3 [Acropora digitifera]|uniref:EGF-like repeat and discoidin I-like domain-containing protein 3 n=1 Tax=Acropora digitifera TaxID=70779 RepID=UPI00077A0600|nr:PREDICTED: EGF-like repeat and discoidin I-like domain-containing protein 3 [Acropora digitifera]